MRVLLCGGGTAGHVMPAIAIAEIIEKNFKGSTVAFAGRRDGNENKAYKETGHKLYTLEISGLSRTLCINNVKSFLKLIKSGRIAREIIKEFNPDVIIGTGGYVCYPFIRQGQRMKIKTVMHESNVYPGLVTRLLGKRCDKLLLNLEGTRDYLKRTGNTEVVGNPIRSSFSSMHKSEARQRLGIKNDELLIISFGGSLGADKLNEAIIGYIKKYSLKNDNIRHIHATGRARYNKIKETHPELFSKGATIQILPYIDNMPLLLTAADLAITRSGAITISELCRSGTPSILIPSPNVTANHQYVNASYMRDIGAAQIIEEKDLNCDALKVTVSTLTKNDDLMKRMSRCARRAYRRNTDQKIANILNKLING